MSASPSCNPLMSPVVDTLTTSAALLPHVMPALESARFAESTTAAESFSVPFNTSSAESGVTVIFAGGPSTMTVQVLVAVAVLRGSGVAAVKSADGSPVYVHPPLPRNAAVVLDSVGVNVPQFV